MKHLMAYIKPFLNWRFLISFGIPWMIVNGWSWIGVSLIPIIGLNWFTSIALAWQGILWMPFTAEKIVTIPAAIWIHTKLFKNDEKTHKQLIHMKHTALHDYYNIKRRIKTWQKTKH